MDLLYELGRLFLNFGFAVQRQQRLQEIQEFFDNYYSDEIDFHGLDENEIEEAFSNASNNFYTVQDFLEGAIPESEEKRIFDEYFHQQLIEHINNNCYSKSDVEEALEKHDYDLESFEEHLKDKDYDIEELLNDEIPNFVLLDILEDMKTEKEWNNY